MTTVAEKKNKQEEGGGWYDRGTTKEKLQKAEQEREGGGVRRYWMPPNTSKKIIMLDDEEFCIHEHNPKINGDYRNWFTCRIGADPNDPTCPMCASKVRRYYIGFITVLDATGWTTREGKQIIYQRQLFPMKVESLKRFKVIKHKKTHLVGAMFDVTRTDDKSPQCGDMFDFEDYVDLDDKKFWYDSKLEKKKKKPEPFDYIKIFKPLSSAEMRAIGVGGDDLYGKGSDDSDNVDDSDADAFY